LASTTSLGILAPSAAAAAAAESRPSPPPPPVVVVVVVVGETSDDVLPVGARQQLLRDERVRLDQLPPEPQTLQRRCAVPTHPRVGRIAITVSFFAIVVAAAGGSPSYASSPSSLFLLLLLLLPSIPRLLAVPHRADVGVDGVPVLHAVGAQVADAAEHPRQLPRGPRSHCCPLLLLLLASPVGASSGVVRRRRRRRRRRCGRRGGVREQYRPAGVHHFEGQVHVVVVVVVVVVYIVYVVYGVYVPFPDFGTIIPIGLSATASLAARFAIVRRRLGPFIR